MILGLRTIRRRMTSGATIASNKPTRPAVDVATVSPNSSAPAVLSTAMLTTMAATEGPPMRLRRVEHEQERPAAEGDAEQLAGRAVTGEHDDRQQDQQQDDAECVGPCELRSQGLEPRLVGWAGGHHRGAW